MNKGPCSYCGCSKFIEYNKDLCECNHSKERHEPLRCKFPGCYLIVNSSNSEYCHRKHGEARFVKYISEKEYKKQKEFYTKNEVQKLQLLLKNHYRNFQSDPSKKLKPPSCFWKIVPLLLSLFLSAVLILPSGEKLPESVKTALSEGNISVAYRILKKDFPTHSYIDILNEILILVKKAKSFDKSDEVALSFLQEAKSRLPSGKIQQVAEFYPLMCGIHWNITRDNEYFIYGLWARRRLDLVTEMENVCSGSILRGDTSLQVYLGSISTLLNRGKLNEAATLLKAPFKGKEWNSLKATYLFLLGAQKTNDGKSHFSEACKILAFSTSDCYRMSNLTLLHSHFFIKEDSRKFIELLDELFDLQPSGLLETLSSFVSYFPERARIRKHVNKAEDMFWLRLLIEAYIVQNDFSRARMILEVLMETEKTKEFQEIYEFAGKLEKFNNILISKSISSNLSSVLAAELHNTSSKVILSVLHSMRARIFASQNKTKLAMEEAKLSIGKFRNYKALEVLGDCYAANKSSIEASEHYKEAFDLIHGSYFQKIKVMDKLQKIYEAAVRERQKKGGEEDTNCTRLFRCSSEDELYKLFQLNKDCSKHQVKKKHRSLAKEYHPDKRPMNQRECAEINYRELTAAYEQMLTMCK